MQHTVLYDDGQKERLVLANERWEPCDPPLSTRNPETGPSERMADPKCAAPGGGEHGRAKQRRGVAHQAAAAAPAAVPPVKSEAPSERAPARAPNPVQGPWRTKRNSTAGPSIPAAAAARKTTPAVAVAAPAAARIAPLAAASTLPDASGNPGGSAAPARSSVPIAAAVQATSPVLALFPERPATTPPPLAGPAADATPAAATQKWVSGEATDWAATVPRPRPPSEMYSGVFSPGAFDEPAAAGGIQRGGLRGGSPREGGIEGRVEPEGSGGVSAPVSLRIAFAGPLKKEEGKRGRLEAFCMGVGGGRLEQGLSEETTHLVVEV